MTTWATCVCFTLAADGSLSTSAGLKKDFLRLPVGDPGGELPLEKLEVEVADPLEHRLSIELEESRNSVRGASWVSAGWNIKCEFCNE